MPYKQTGLFICLLWLVACAPPTTTRTVIVASTPAPSLSVWELAREATRTAQQSQQLAQESAAYQLQVERATTVAGETRTAIAQQATATAETITREAEQTRTAIEVTAVAIQTTREHEAWQLTRQASQAEAVYQQQLAAIEVTRQAQIALEQAMNLERRKQWQAFVGMLPYFLLGLIGFGLYLGYRLWQHRERPVVVQELPTGQLVVLVLTNDGYQPVNDPNLLLPSPQARVPVLPAPVINETRNNYQPAVTQDGYCPIDFGTVRTGSIGLGATPSAQIWLPEAALQDMLIGGMKGSGKSTFLRLVAYQAILQGYACFFLDAEAFTFNGRWGEVARTNGDCLALLEHLIRIADARLAHYQQVADVMVEAYNGRYLTNTQGRVLQDGEGRPMKPFMVEKLTDYRKALALLKRGGWEAVQGLPDYQPIAIFWDEAPQHLMGDRKIMEATLKFIYRGRKPGAFMLMASQTWHNKSLPMNLRNAFGMRVAFRCTEATSRALLPDKSTLAATIPEGWGGHAFLWRQGAKRIGRVQTFYLPDERIFDDLFVGERPFLPEMAWRDVRETAVPQPIIQVQPSQAELDGKQLQSEAEPSQFTSRSRVAKWLTRTKDKPNGLDNGYAYSRAHHALYWLFVHGGDGWSATAEKLLSSIKDNDLFRKYYLNPDDEAWAVGWAEYKLGEERLVALLAQKEVGQD